MKIFENYNTAKQKYGEELANSVLSNGIPNEYVYTACRYYTEDNIPIDVLQQKFRQWMSYIRNLGKETFNINNLSYQQFDNIIRDEIQKAMKPNPIYDDGTIFMGEFKTKEDALLYPIPNEWCTSNSSSKYNQYVGDGYRLFVIENKSLDEPLKYVCASVYNGRVIYWDVNDNQLYEDLRDYTNVNNSEHETYQRTLPKQIVDYLYNIAAEQTDEIENKQNINCNRNMNTKLIRLTESDLHKIVKESVNRILKEAYSDIYGDGLGINYPKSMYDNAYFLSNTPEEFDERMKERQIYLNCKNRLALNNHPQATPFRGLGNNELSSGKSMDASLYKY